MNEAYFLTPLARSKMLTKVLEKSPEESLFDEQHDAYKQEINKHRESINQSNIQHENRLRELRISYEHQLQTLKQHYEDEIKNLQDRLWNTKHSFDQEKQLQLTRSHRFTISKLEYSEKIEGLQKKKQSLTKELLLLNQTENRSHQMEVNSLKAQYDGQSSDFRVEKRKCEELVAEENCRFKERLQEKTQKIETLLGRKQLLNENLAELQAQNTEKMQKIEKALRSSQRKVDSHEEKMNQVLEVQNKHQIDDLEAQITEKDLQIAKAKEKNERLTDQLLKLEKILYGKAPN